MQRFSTLLSLLAALLLGTSLAGHAQAPAWQAALAAPGVMGSLTGSTVSATATDASGNVYIAGSFVGALTLGNVSLPSTGFPADGFVAKWLPATSTFAWIVRIASPARATTRPARWRLLAAACTWAGISAVPSPLAAPR